MFANEKTPLVINGHPIFINDAICCFSVPIVGVEQKAWHKGRCYPQRLQKKYNKRFGTYRKSRILKTPMGIFLSSIDYAKLQAQLAGERDGIHSGFRSSVNSKL